MRVLVTGGTGFLGSHLIPALLKRGDEVVCLVKEDIRWADAGIQCTTVDLSNLMALRHCLADMRPCEALVHFGAVMPSNSSAGPEALSPYLNANVTATAHLLETASSWGGCSFVYASGITVVGRPTTIPTTEDQVGIPEHPYLLSKYQAELLCEYFRRKGLLAASSLRISSPYGPGMSKSTVLPFFVGLARESKDIQIYGTGHRTQNFVHVSDVVQATLLAIETRAPGVYNVAGPRSISMLELARAVVMAVPGCKSQITLAGKPDPQEDCRWEVDTHKAAKGLGYHARIDLAAGLGDYISHLSPDSSADGLARWWNPCA